MDERAARVCEHALRAADKKGAQYCDVYLFQERGTSAATRSPSSDSPDGVGEDTGLSVRLVRGGRLGFSYSSGLSRREIESAVEGAARLSKYGPEFRYEGLPSSVGVVESLSGYDHELGESTQDDVAREVIDHCRRISDLGQSVFSGHLQVFVWNEYLANSFGLWRSSQKTFSMLELLIHYHAGQFSRFLSESATLQGLDVVSPVESMVSTVTRRLARTKVGAFKGRVCLLPQALANLIRFSLGRSLEGDKIESHESAVASRVADLQWAEDLKVVNNPGLKGGTYSADFDGEGFPTARTVLIDHGRISSFLTDSHYSHVLSVPHTASSFREGYWTQPRIRAHNLELVMPEIGDDPVSSLENGLLIPGFENFPDSDSFMFRALCDDIYVVRNRRVVGRTGLAECRFDVDDFFSRIAMTCGDQVQLWGVCSRAGISEDMALPRISSQGLRALAAR